MNYCKECTFGGNGVKGCPHSSECIISGGCTPSYFISKANKIDVVNHPLHYAEGRKYEPIDVIYDWDLDFMLGNVVKYISRAGRKNDIVEDLEKAKFYLEAKIKKEKETKEIKETK